MLTILDLINHYLGYFTTNSKTKGRIYTVVSAIGVWYLLYLAYRFFANGRWLRGTLIAGVFILLLYFVFLNILYYFTKSVTKWDVSPYIEKLLGGPHVEEETQQQTVIMPANGLYERQDVMPGVVDTNATQQANMDLLATELEQLGLMSTNYGHLGTQAQRHIIAQHDIIFANHPGTLLPYFDMVTTDNTVKIMGGVNQLQARELATLSMVGMVPARQAMEKYHLALASVVLNGGIGHTATRTELIETEGPYSLKVEVAYEKRR
ncbi:DUF6681 family protein [Leuconostoc carnosum]|uniref:DUF6681 family protein n=1 Tax=Leuconostoc carnosum TaxID=1252 RepID=UPI00345C7F72